MTWENQIEPKTHRPGFTKLLHLSHRGMSSEKILSAKSKGDIKVPNEITTSSLNTNQRHLSSSPGCTSGGRRSSRSGTCRTSRELRSGRLPRGRPRAPECRCSEWTLAYKRPCKNRKEYAARVWRPFSYLCVAAPQVPLVLQQLNEIVTECRLNGPQTPQKKQVRKDYIFTIFKCDYWTCIWVLYLKLSWVKLFGQGKERLWMFLRKTI